MNRIANDRSYKFITHIRKIIDTFKINSNLSKITCTRVLYNLDFIFFIIYIFNNTYVSRIYILFRVASLMLTFLSHFIAISLTIIVEYTPEAQFCRSNHKMPRVILISIKRSIKSLLL